MDNLRLFISLPLEDKTAQRLNKEFKRLTLPWEKLKPVAIQDMHLTLKFLGDTPLDKLPEIISALETVQLDVENLDLKISGTKIFSPHRPQVIVLNITNNPALQELYQQIEESLFKAALAHKEMKQFSPHITLARVKQAASLDEFKALESWQVNQDFHVNHFDLQESVLTTKGPEYTILQSFDL